MFKSIDISLKFSRGALIPWIILLKLKTEEEKKNIGVEWSFLIQFLCVRFEITKQYFDCEL